MQCTVVDFSGASQKLLMSQEFSIIKPDFRHCMHIDECSLVKVVNHFKVFVLGEEVELLNVKSGLFQVVKPEFIATWKVLESTLIQTCSFFEVFLGLSQNCVPPRTQVVYIKDARGLQKC